MNGKIVSEEYADIIIDNNSKYAKENPENITYINQRNSILHVPVSDINKCSVADYSYANFPLCYTLESIISLEKSGITRIQNNPNLALNGQGVIIGVIDTGIDYQHEAFLYTDKTTKIISIWDQTINNETKSENIEYGTEYDRKAINSALKSSNPLEIVPSSDEIGHGTMIAGIISGNESLENNFRGVVPNSELVVVKLKQAKKITRDIFAISKEAICYQTTDILFAINYIQKKADQLKRPLALCIALGSNQGGHDGLGPLSWYLSSLADYIGIGEVIAGGNEGNSRRHYYGTVDNQNFSNTFELKVGANEFGFTMEIWESVPNLLSVEITSPLGEYVNPIFPSRNICRRISFIFERTIMYVDNIILESSSGDQVILIRFEFPTEGIWKFKVTNINKQVSDFNAWLPSGDLITDETYFLNSNPDITLTAPAYSIVPLTITAYNHSNDSIWIDSSRGFSRSDIIKPDLAAPGVDLVCPILNNAYGSVTGSGAAAAHATGIVAMFLEWGIVKGNYTTIHGNEIKNILIRGAKREKELTYPNKIWGYGIIDVFGAFNSLRT